MKLFKSWGNNKNDDYNPADYMPLDVSNDTNQKQNLSKALVDFLDNGSNNYAAANEEEQASEDNVSKSINKNGKATAIDNQNYTNFDSSFSSIGSGMNSLSEILSQKQLLNTYSKDSLVQAIIRTRINQVLVYARPARYSRTGRGFEIIPKDFLSKTSFSTRSDKKSDKMTPQQENIIKKLEDEISSLGDDTDYNYSRKSFGNFLASIIHDRYVYDQVNVERIFDKDGKLNHFNNVDASTIVIDKHPKSIDTPRTFSQYSSRTVGKPIAKFTEKELTFYTANNYSSIYRNGYGYSEVEASLLHLRYHEDTEQFNARFFSQGGTTRGILLINPGDSNAQQNLSALAALRRNWQANFSGNNGAWKTPVMMGQDAKYVNMTQSSKDMEFEHWLNYMINIISSIFQMQPDEINFPNKGGASGMHAGNSVNEGSTSKSKMKQSQDKGLEPLLQSIEEFITNEILQYLPNGDKYIFRFTLGDSEDAEREQAIIKAKLDNGETIGEARKEMGLPEIDTSKLPESMKYINYMPGSPATIVQFMQFINAQDQTSQYAMQHKNDIDPSKADHKQPEKGMPVSAINDKTKSPDQQRNKISDDNDTDDTVDPDTLDN